MVMSKVIRGMKTIVPAALAAIGVGMPAQASVISGTSSAYTAGVDVGYSINVPFLPPITGSLSSTVGELTRSTAPTYNVSNTPAALSINVPASGNLLSVTSGLLSNTITSNVDGGFGSRITTADSEIANASILVGSLLSVTVGAIHQNATAMGDYGSMQTSGSLNVENLVVKLAGNTIFTLTGDVGANFDVGAQAGAGGLLGAGISLILNRQTDITIPASGLGISTDALVLSVDASLLGLASLNGDVVLGHAEAFQNYSPNAVPEPASIAMLGLGVVGAGLAGLRRRKAA